MSLPKGLIPTINLETASRDALIRHIEVLTFKLDEILPTETDLRVLQSVYGLTEQQAIIVFCLSNGRIWSHNQLMIAASRWSEDAELGVIKAQLCRVRKKLLPTIRIKTIWGFGYQIAEGAEEICRVMRGEA